MSNGQHLTLEQRLQLRQSLTPLQVQYFRLLEMTEQQMEQEVERRLDENPALERVEETIVSEGERFNESAEELQRADYRTEDDLPGWFSPGMGIGSEAPLPDDGTSLAETLREQIERMDLPEGIARLASYIAGAIDANGYLTRSVDDLMIDIALSGTEAEPEREDIRRAIAVVQSLEPAGIGAYDLRQALLLQLRRMGGEGAEADALEIVTHYFDLFSANRADRLATASGMSPERVAAAYKVIRRLNPKPGAGIGESASDDRRRHIIPDFILEIVGEGELKLTRNSTVPELQIEVTFRADSEGDTRNVREASARKFIAVRREEAADFIRVLKMRNETLTRVASAVVEAQRAFLLTGDESRLRPMVLRDIAEVTGDDVSVISRSTSGKYISTPYGTYPFRYFFNEAALGSDGGAARPELLAQLRQIVAEEDSSEPLSDEKLSELLNKKGYRVARRTIAKYRQMASIPPARLRRNITKP